MNLRTRRVRVVVVIAVSTVALFCLARLLMPSIDGTPVSVSVIKVKAALSAYYAEHGRYPRNLAEIEPHLSKQFPGSTCAVVRTGDSEYRLSVDKAGKSLRFRVRYRASDGEHVEVFDVALK